MNFFNFSPTERILDWRNFRKELKNKEEKEQLEEIAKYWSNIPLKMFSIDWDRPDTWTSPWEMLYEFDLDSNAVAILMEQTLILSGWDALRIKLCYINNIVRKDQTMAVIIDNKYVLNYSVGEVFDLDRVKNDCIFLVKYQYINNQHVEV